MRKVHACSHEITSSYYKNTVTTDLKNKLEAKILDEATRVVNVFLIS